MWASFFPTFWGVCLNFDVPQTPLAQCLSHCLRSHICSSCSYHAWVHECACVPTSRAYMYVCRCINVGMSCMWCAHCDSQQGNSSPALLNSQGSFVVGNSLIIQNHTSSCMWWNRADSLPVFCTVCNKKLGRSLGTWEPGNEGSINHSYTSSSCSDWNLSSMFQLWFQNGGSMWCV